MSSDVLLVVVIGTALAFDFTNGFHDSANAVATAIATGALRPRTAVAISAVLNVIGAFLSVAVATTIAKGIVDSAVVTLPIVFAALAGAILWNVLTWYLGLPSSSSHALIGGLVGATLAVQGHQAVRWDGLIERVAVPAVAAPLLAGLVALAGTVVTTTVAGRVQERLGQRGYRFGQIGSACLLSLAHGTNDAQKTMGVISLALVAHGSKFSVPDWVIVSAALAMGLGTYAGGWRVMRTLGRRLTPVEPPQGFATEVSAATVIVASAIHGYPLSTTHVVSGGVVGSGLARRLGQIRWRLAGQMAGAWAVTVPASAAVAAVVGVAIDLAGGTAAALICLPIGATGVLAIWAKARRAPVTAENVNAEGSMLVPPATERPPVSAGGAP